MRKTPDWKPCNELSQRDFDRFPVWRFDIARAERSRDPGVDETWVRPGVSKDDHLLVRATLIDDRRRRHAACAVVEPIDLARGRFKWLGAALLEPRYRFIDNTQLRSRGLSCSAIVTHGKRTFEIQFPAAPITDVADVERLFTGKIVEFELKSERARGKSRRVELPLPSGRLICVDPESGRVLSRLPPMRRGMVQPEILEARRWSYHASRVRHLRGTFNEVAALRATFQRGAAARNVTRVLSIPEAELGLLDAASVPALRSKVRNGKWHDELLDSTGPHSHFTIELGPSAAMLVLHVPPCAGRYMLKVGLDQKGRTVSLVADFRNQRSG